MMYALAMSPAECGIKETLTLEKENMKNRQTENNCNPKKNYGL